MRQESTAGRWRGSIALAAAALACCCVLPLLRRNFANSAREVVGQRTHDAPHGSPEHAGEPDPSVQRGPPLSVPAGTITRTAETERAVLAGATNWRR